MERYYCVDFGNNIDGVNTIHKTREGAEKEWLKQLNKFQNKVDSGNQKGYYGIMYQESLNNKSKPELLKYKFNGNWDTEKWRKRIFNRFA